MRSMKKRKVNKGRVTKVVHQRVIVEAFTARVRELLQGAGNLLREDFEYVATVAGQLEDDRLKRCIAELMRWGDEERDELETFVAIASECMLLCDAETLSRAARNVEMRHYLRKERSLENPSYDKM